MSVYRVTEVIGVSEQSWEDAAREAVTTAAATVRDPDAWMLRTPAAAGKRVAAAPAVAGVVVHRPRLGREIPAVVDLDVVQERPLARHPLDGRGAWIDAARIEPEAADDVGAARRRLEDRLRRADVGVFRRLFAYVTPHKGRLVVATFSLLMVSLMSLIFPWIVRSLVDSVLVHHDERALNLITVGLFSIFHEQISMTVIAALLTLVGYSMNDTIVIFDRIRENLKISRREPLEQVMNRAVNQTLSRTLLSSLTVWLVVIVLYAFGGEGVHLFAFVMVVGVVVGTYSSIYIASPLLLIFGEGVPAKPRRELPREAVAARG